jgi:molecular chaperone DnaK (HSP70)
MDNSWIPEGRSHGFVIGIDLGTTNSAVAYVNLVSPPENRSIKFLKIPQLVAPGEVSSRRVLPSFLYLPGPYELPPGSTGLPWNKEKNEIVGEFAREQGALVPGRLVSSAKSWLAHSAVDRTAQILPWGNADSERKVSPVEASACYLKHIREAWNEQMARGGEGYAFEEQLLILTVPASFDEVARELTVSAAQAAGIPRIVLIEEPLAAFYSWLFSHESDWQDKMKPGQLIWVCDVGGGTTDFTIIAIRGGEKGLRFDRLAVGDHLMLGGDNMDFALGRLLEKRLSGRTGSLDSKRWYQLCHQCRKAKEALLGSKNDSKMDIIVTGVGGKLIAGTMRGELTGKEVRDLILNGFFPPVSLTEPLVEDRPKGLTEWGLPYVREPAVTRHLSRFWQLFRDLIEEETGRKDPYPDFLLFNGGALAPAAIRTRLTGVVKEWFMTAAGEDWNPEVLENPHPDLAVAMGAAYYGMVRLGQGVQVGAGSPRAYYVEVTGGDGGATGEYQRAVCLVPRGTEEGFEAKLETPSFEVLANQPVVFQLLSSSTRLTDRLGDVVEVKRDEVSLFPPIRTVLRFGKKGETRKLPVQIAVRLTEVGTLELWCRSQKTPHRWQLQFDVRQGVDPYSFQEVPGETFDASVIERTQEIIRKTFGKGNDTGDYTTEGLVKTLEEILEEEKEKWPTPLIRRLADDLIECESGRGLTAQHEARWFNLLGFCMRPGFGDSLDEWRIEEAWKFYLQGLRFPKQVAGRAELWVFIRRVAGGLSAGRQWHIYREVSPYLQSTGAKKGKARYKFPKRLNPHEEIEAWMAVANFERLPVDEKIGLGRTLLGRIQKKTRPQEIWAISRLGARKPFYGPLDRVIPANEASEWLKTLFSMDVRSNNSLAHAAVQLARVTGDRARDVSPEDLDQVRGWLEEATGYEALLEILLGGHGASSRQEQDWVFGETLPSGLILSGTDLSSPAN